MPIKQTLSNFQKKVQNVLAKIGKKIEEMAKSGCCCNEKNKDINK